MYTASSNILKKRTLYWWRRGESEYLKALKTRNLLIFGDTRNAEHGKIAPNWNVSGTRDFVFPFPSQCSIRLGQDRWYDEIIPDAVGQITKIRAKGGPLGGAR
jgi:hypothetical protein